jgi:hypothetical protein
VVGERGQQREAVLVAGAAGGQLGGAPAHDRRRIRQRPLQIPGPQVVEPLQRAERGGPHAGIRIVTVVAYGGQVATVSRQGHGPAPRDLVS